MRLLLFFLICFSVQLGFAQSPKYTWVFLNSKPDKEQLTDVEAEALQKAHMANIDALAKEGKILIAGPFEGGGGIFVLSTGSLATAKEWIMTDPAVEANRWNVELYPFTISKGNICQPPEPFEMVTHNFIRFSVQNEIADYKSSGAVNTSSSDLYMVNALSKQGNLLLMANFLNNEGGIILYQGDDQSNLVNEDQALISGGLTIIEKKVWIAKGSFCEH